MIYSDTDDYKNPERIPKYRKVSIGIPLTIPIDKSGNINTYVGVEFEVHKDMRSHTGGFMTMVTGGAYYQCSKTKTNTNISNEADLVVVDYVLTQMIWTRYFLKEQG